MRSLRASAGWLQIQRGQVRFALVPAEPPVNPIVTISDDFNRADGPLGPDWPFQTQTWAVVSNGAKCTAAPGTTGAHAMRDFGQADGVLEVFMPVVTTNSYVGFRFVDARNRWAIGSYDFDWQLYRVIDGVAVSVARIGTDPANNSRISIAMKGPLIVIYLNRVEIMRVTDPAHQSATWGGLTCAAQSSAIGNAIWDDVVFTPWGGGPAAASVTLAPSEAFLVPGQTWSYRATVKDAGGTTLLAKEPSWSSSNTAVATVDQSGVVTAVAAGSATITATVEGVSGSAPLTVQAVTLAATPALPAFGANEPQRPAAGSPLLLKNHDFQTRIQACSTTAQMLALFSGPLVGTDGMRLVSGMAPVFGAEHDKVIALDWNKVTSTTDQSRQFLQTLRKADGSLPDEFFLSYMQYMGRRPEDLGSNRAIDRFDFTNALLPPTNNNSGRKMSRILKTGGGAAGSFDLLWNGPSPSYEHIGGQGAMAVSNPNGGNATGHLYENGPAFAPEDHYHEVIRLTWHVKKESVTGAGDGIIRLWINGVLRFDYLDALNNDSLFDRWEWPIIINSPAENMTEYISGPVAWLAA